MSNQSNTKHQALTNTFSDMIEQMLQSNTKHQALINTFVTLLLRRGFNPTRVEAITKTFSDMIEQMLQPNINDSVRAELRRDFSGTVHGAIYLPLNIPKSLPVDLAEIARSQSVYTPFTGQKLPQIVIDSFFELIDANR